MVLTFYHQPVMLNEILSLAKNISKSGVLIDATLGGSGHTKGISEFLGKEGTLIGIDRDLKAIETAKTRLKDVLPEVILEHSQFSEIHSIMDKNSIPSADFILADLGVSSHQLDVSERGFSFQKDGPLDMRMNKNEGKTLQEMLNNVEQGELAEIIKDYGEENFAQSISRSIIKARDEGELDSTLDLANAIKRVKPVKHPKKGHKKQSDPATKTFQALRIWVNSELDQLKDFLDDAPLALANGGTLAIITFHSLEDRIVKRKFRDLAKPETLIPTALPLTKEMMPTARYRSLKPIKPTLDEINSNPRSRSAILRVLIKSDKGN